jgi:hypothetical protein
VLVPGYTDTIYIVRHFVRNGPTVMPGKKGRSGRNRGEISGTPTAFAGIHLLSYRLWWQLGARRASTMPTDRSSLSSTIWQKTVRPYEAPRRNNSSRQSLSRGHIYIFREIEMDWNRASASVSRE